MGRKQKHEEHENLERWLVSYADFITLLFATFTALYAMSQMDISRMKDLEKYIQQGFQEQSIVSGVKAIFKTAEKSDTTPSPRPDITAGKGNSVLDKDSLTFSPGEKRDIEKTLEDLKRDLEPVNEDIAQQAAAGPRLKDGELPPKGIDVAIQDRGLRISFDSSLLFESGSAALRPQAYEALSKVGERLKKYNLSHTFQVEGHTDNIPISTAIYPSNWELSTARASSVVRYMIRKHGFSATSMIAAGYADSRPLSNNYTREGRRKNRRVDIILYSRHVGSQTEPTTQYSNENAYIDGLKHSRKMDRTNQLIREESETPGGAVEVIYEQPDGTRKVVAPKPAAKPGVAPELAPDLGKREGNP